MMCDIKGPLNVLARIVYVINIKILENIDENPETRKIVSRDGIQ